MLVETARFRLVGQDQTSGFPRFHLEVRSGRLSGDEAWYRSHGIGDWEGFGLELGKSLWRASPTPPTS